MATQFHHRTTEPSLEPRMSAAEEEAPHPLEMSPKMPSDFSKHDDREDDTIFYHNWFSDVFEVGGVCPYSYTPLFDPSQ